MPRVVREAGMAYLRFVAERFGVATAVSRLLDDVLARSGESEILDLCSGGGGPMLAVARAMRQAGRNPSITLSDRYPDAGARRLAQASGIEGLRYERESVDALDVPSERRGLRTLFNAFHHLRPEQARDVLAAAVAGRRPIAVVEFLQRRPFLVFSACLAPLVVLIAVPFLRPFRWSWLPLTYLIPAIPLLVVWDAVVSCLRIYTRDELLELSRDADPDGRFEWRVEEIPLAGQPFPGIALVGLPH